MIRLATVRRILLVFALMPVGWSFPASGNVFYRDRRVTEPLPSDSPLRAVGHLTNQKDGARGTAFLVGPCHALTNYHVAFADEEAGNYNEISLFETPGFAPVEARPVASGKYRPDMKNRNDHDWALLRLKECLGEKVGWLSLRALSKDALTSPGTTVFSIGFPSDRTIDSPTIDRQCRIHREDLDGAGGWRHDCATRTGNSGGPLLWIDSSGRAHVVALVASEINGFPEIIRTYSVHLSNGAIPVERILPFLPPLGQ